MNLVQINERLKEMPLQVVQQYANGSSPEVPPYLALGELQRRETMQKQMATASGAAQGPQPSIKEQIEQKAGLMALQQMQQQQAAQPQVRPGGPIPGNVPQPVPQETAMAYGGLAALPVNSNMYNFDCGGIVAFAGETNGSYVSDAEKEDRKKKLRHYTLQEQGADWVARKAAAREADPEREQRVEKIRDFEAGLANLIAGTGAQGVKEPIAVAAPPVSRLPTQESAPPPRLPNGRPNPAYLDFIAKEGSRDRGMDPFAYDQSKLPMPAPGIGLPTIIADQKASSSKAAPPQANPMRNAPAKNAAATPPVNTAVPPTAATAASDSGIPGLTDPAFMEAAKKALAAPDEAKMIEAEMARRKAFGVEGKAGEEQERRLRDMMSEYEKAKESRGLERLMEVLGGRSLGEMGTNYLNYENRQRAADRAQAMKMNELLSAIESGRRTEGIAGAKGIGESIEKRADRASQLAGQLGAQQMQSAVSRENQLSQNRTQLQIAELDRALREKLHKTPAAQIPSIEREMLDVYTRQFNGDRAKAYEHLKTILQENKSELNQPQLIRKYVEDWNKLDPATRMNYEKQGIKTVDDYVAHMNKTTNRLLGGAQSGKSPTLPAGFQLDK